MKTLVRLWTVWVALCLAAAAQNAPVLLHKPAVGAADVVFTYGDDLWSAPRDGGAAHPLTTGSGVKTDPAISPDGKWIAFTGAYEGNADVYVMPASGGVPKRLTFHPGADVVSGWTPDSKAVLFRSNRNSYSRFARLFTVTLEAGCRANCRCPKASWGRSRRTANPSPTFRRGLGDRARRGSAIAAG